MTGRTKARLISLRMWVRRRDKRVVRLVIFALFIFVTVGLYRGDSGSREAYPAIRSINTDESIFAVTVVISGDEDEEDISALSETCLNLGVRPVYFAQIGWIEGNMPLCEEIISRGGTIGLFIPDYILSKSRMATLDAVASLNDAFYKALGKYPRYVTCSGKDSDTLSSVLLSFGQYLLSKSGTVTASEYPQVTSGMIVELSVIDTESTGNLVACVAGALSAGISPVEMKSFLYECGSPVDENGMLSDESA